VSYIELKVRMLAGHPLLEIRPFVNALSATRGDLRSRQTEQSRAVCDFYADRLISVNQGGYGKKYLTLISLHPIIAISIACGVSAGMYPERIISRLPSD